MPPNPPSTAYLRHDRCCLQAYRTQTGDFLGWDHNGLAENWQQLEIWVFLYDVEPGMAPLQFLPSDGPEALADLDDKTEVEQVLVPAGSVAVWVRVPSSP